MAKKENRFERVYSQGGFTRAMEIWVDRQTGVNYVCTQSGYGGGMTVLLNRDGTPVVTPVSRNYEEE